MIFTRFGPHEVSRFILGTNPFAGFSHQGLEVDSAMRAYFTREKAVETLRDAEELGINSVLARADDNTLAYLKSHWELGGRLRWFAQTCPELGDPEVSIRRAAAAGAMACYIHGGVMDTLLAQGGLQIVPDRIRLIRDLGMLAGVAGHRPAVFRWAEETFPPDFYMCSYYDPTPRDGRGAHIHGAVEAYRDSDREAMTSQIRELPRPVIHYKILAAGRNDPEAAFSYAARSMRRQDAVCVGVYTEKQPDMLREDVGLFCRALEEVATGTAPVLRQL